MAGSAHAGDGLVVESFNVGLAHGFVAHAAERKAAIVEAVVGSEADVMCLQEVWRQEDRDDVQDALRDALGDQAHLFHLAVEQKDASSAPACGMGQLFGEGRFVSCMQESCGGMDGKELTDCIVNSCGLALSDLKDEEPECAQALMSQVGRSAFASLWTVLQPFYYSGVYAYDGSDGLMMVSRTKPVATGSIDFTQQSTLNRRRAYYMDVPVDGQNLRVYCTHLTAELSKTAPYPGKFASWEEENRVQAELLIEHADGFNGPVVMAGDFNCSLPNDSGDIAGEHEGTCRRILAAGFSDPAATDLAQCTYCGDNALLAEGGKNVLLDHLYARGWGASDVRRLYDAPVDVAGVDEAVPLSDHYAIRARFMAPPPPEDEAAQEEDNEG
jgi:endonuclease/exonuclease/phosphatase family metal-dependent hydrolase